MRDHASESAITGVHHRLERRPRVLYGDALAPGAIVGAYRVEALAARGGFAAVYRARHLTLARTVAIKVLHRELATTTDMLRRFVGEAHAVNRIAHPNIVDIRDVGTLRDGRPYLVMEWIEGRALEAELAARGPLTALETLAVMEDLLPALAAAHDAGVIHRDLTAGNVLVVPRGHWFTVKLVDFGIAKLVAGDEPGGASTSSEVRLGTPSHMAPEQIRGDGVDERTDIYGAGVLLFQLLTGRVPFVAGSSLELADLHLEAIAPRVSSCVPIPAAVDDVVARCLAKAPAERWPDARALLSALRAAIVGEPAPTAPDLADAAAIHVESHVADPDRASEAAFSAIDDQLAASLAAFEAAGLIIADRGATEVLAVGFAPARALEVARGLARSLPRRDGVDVAITVHVDRVAVRGRELAGALLAAGTWKADAPAPDVQLTPAARRRLG
jgi:serine/threonine-protein kinase